MFREIIYQFGGAPNRDARKLAHPRNACRLHNTVDAVAHADVSLYRAFGVGLGQPLVNGIRLGGHTICHRINIGGGTTYIHANQLTNSIFTFTAVR